MDKITRSKTCPSSSFHPPNYSLGGRSPSLPPSFVGSVGGSRPVLFGGPFVNFAGEVDLRAGVYLPAFMVRDLLAILAAGARSSVPFLVHASDRYRKTLDERRTRIRDKDAVPVSLQLPLWSAASDGTIEVWWGRLDPDAPVVCDHFNAAEIPLRTCLLRQGARWPGGNRWKDGTVREKKAAIHPYCASGKCGQGREYAGRIKGEWIQPRFKFYRDDTPQQRSARKDFRRTRLDYLPTMDSPDGEPEVRDTMEIDEDVSDLPDFTRKD